MQEKITIENFCGIKHYNIDLKSINVFIGENGVGKSVTAKLVYFFKNIFNKVVHLFSINNFDHSYDLKIVKEFLAKSFGDYFPSG